MLRRQLPLHRCFASVLVAAGAPLQPPTSAGRRRLCCRPRRAGDHRQPMGRKQSRGRIPTRSMGRCADLARRSDVLGVQCRRRSTARCVLELCSKLKIAISSRGNRSKHLDLTWPQERLRHGNGLHRLGAGALHSAACKCCYWSARSWQP